MQVTGKVRHEQADPARRLRVPALGDVAHAEGDDSVADDAALSRRTRARSAGRLSGSRRVLCRCRRRLCRRTAEPRRRRAARTCSSTTRTSPTCATRRCAKAARQRGDDPNELPRRYAKLINAAIARRPKAMTVCIHLCRGNFKSAWAAEGGYEPVAEVLFNELAVDGYFLEYDDPRSGDFAPLRHVPKGKIVVLGLVSTKVGELESKDDAEAAHRRGGEARAARAALPVAAVRIFEHRARQRHRGRVAGGEAAARHRHGARGVGSGLTC